jgi:prepilin peptidase CpaA
MPGVPILLDVLLAMLVLLAAATDLLWRRIPNLLTGGGLLAALVLHLLDGGGRFPLAWLGGALTGLALLLPLYLLRGMAAGDVKLMAMVGAFTGPTLALHISLATFIIGGVMALAIVLYRRRWRDTLDNIRALLVPWSLRAGGVSAVPQARPRVASVGNMPYGLAIALGTWLLLASRHG